MAVNASGRLGILDQERAYMSAQNLEIFSHLQKAIVNYSKTRSKFFDTLFDLIIFVRVFEIILTRRGPGAFNEDQKALKLTKHTHDKWISVYYAGPSCASRLIFSSRSFLHSISKVMEVWYTCLAGTLSNSVPSHIYEPKASPPNISDPYQCTSTLLSLYIFSSFEENYIQWLGVGNIVDRVVSSTLEEGLATDEE